MQPGDAHPTRMEYQITENGKKAFVNWLNSIVQHPRDFRQEFMSAIFFLLKYQPENVIHLFTRQYDECSTWLANTIELLNKVSEENQFKKSVIQFRIVQIQSMINWLNKLQIAIKKETDDEEK